MNVFIWKNNFFLNYCYKQFIKLMRYRGLYHVRWLLDLMKAFINECQPSDSLFVPVLSLDTRRAINAFPKVRGTEIRIRGSRGCPVIVPCGETRKFELASRGENPVPCFPHPSTSVDVRAPHGYVLACLLPAAGCFRSQANPFFLVIAICRLIRSTVSLVVYSR